MNHKLSEPLLAALVAIVSTASFGQMMGGPIATSTYFPLVDGARHDYTFVRGPRATASVVMHAGQTWAGMPHLTSVHTTAVCQPSVPCIRDTTDFYRMDPDGMRHFGGESETGGGVHFMTTFSGPEWVLKNPVTPGTMMGPGMGYQNTEMWHAAVTGMNSMAGPHSHTSRYTAQALETVTTPAGTYFNALHVREQHGDGAVRDVWYAEGVGIVRWLDADEEAVLTAVTLPDGPVPAVMRAVEYYHAALDHFFVTADPVEIDALDAGRIAGWQRTAMSFNVLVPSAGTPASASPVCRFYGSPAHGLDTHFYSASPQECAAVAQQWSDRWLLESDNVFRIQLPDAASGACPARTLPVYRTWNGRGDSNHRYTRDQRVQMAMRGMGGIAEGYGDPPIAMCSPR